MKKIFKTIESEISKLEKVKKNMLKERIEGGKKMKVGVSAAGEGLESPVDVRFGRCPNFVVAEIEDKKIKNVKNVKNTAVEQMGGAGITSAELVARQGVKAVLTGNVGPRAFAVFHELGVKVYHASGTVKDAIEKFANGELDEVSNATGPMFMGKSDGPRNNKTDEIK